ncbi:MAG: hypothetical protein RIC93_05685, partial [Alphaproteobacteria bacterium]
LFVCSAMPNSCGFLVDIQKLVFSFSGLNFTPLIFRQARTPSEQACAYLSATLKVTYAALLTVRNQV